MASLLRLPNQTVTEARSGAGQRPPTIPLLSASFAIDLQVFLLLWPLWWLLGVEQLLPPLFLGWELVRSTFRRRGVLSFNGTILAAAALGLWWIVPGLWVPEESWRTFLRELSINWSQVAILLLFANEIRSTTAWYRAATGLSVLAAYVGLGSVIGASGLWRSELESFLGTLLPQRMVQESAFLTSISFRSFYLPDAHTLLPRITSFALEASALSIVCLVLLPFTVWRLATSRRHRLTHALCAAGLLVGLVFAQSRIAFVAALAGLLLLGTILLFRRSDWSIRIAVVALVCGVGLALSGPLSTSFTAWVDSFLIESRPESWLTRARVYRETLKLLPEHPIAGWGAPVRIPELKSVYSAGTHSSYLGILFQHGIVGLVLYLAIWLTIWLAILAGLRRSRAAGDPGVFWLMAAVAMFAFNIREAADTWWWDQLSTLTVWTFWGLILTRHRAVEKLASQPDEVSSP